MGMAVGHDQEGEIIYVDFGTKVVSGRTDAGLKSLDEAGPAGSNYLSTFPDYVLREER